MSRGLGTKQRLILRALELCGRPFYLAALWDGESATAYKSLHRAALKLCDAELIEIRQYQCGCPRLVVASKSVEMTYRHFPGGFSGETFQNIDRKDIEAASERVTQLLKTGELCVEGVPR